MHIHHKQRGGTFVGIIIGLIIGLGIALGVAVAITKTPMPFTNKVVARPDKAEKSADQASDPNKPLYGNKAKVPLKETAKSDDAGAIADAKVESKNDTPPPNTVVADKPKKSDAKPTVAVAPEAKDPIKEIVAKAEAKNSGADLWTYFLQAGAFNDQGDAEGARAKLALMGVEAHVTEKPSPNGTGVLYRVRIGPFTQLEAANRVRGKLSDNGVDATMVRIAKNTQ